MGVIIMIISYLFLLLIDIRLQISEEYNNFLELKLIKVIHDLQNPLSVITDTLEDKEMNMVDANKIIKFELIDLQEIIDNLRAYFKWKTL